MNFGISEKLLRQRYDAKIYYGVTTGPSDSGSPYPWGGYSGSSILPGPNEVRDRMRKFICACAELKSGPALGGELGEEVLNERSEFRNLTPILPGPNKVALEEKLAFIVLFPLSFG